MRVYDDIAVGFWAGFWLHTAALALATLEIEIEGQHGWAEKLPTWRVPSCLSCDEKRPITGYHVALFFTFLTTLFAGHAATAILSDRTLTSGDCLLTLSNLLFFFACEDVAWFCLNPFSFKDHHGGCTGWARRFVPSLILAMVTTTGAAVVQSREDSPPVVSRSEAALGGACRAVGLLLSAMVFVALSYILGRTLYKMLKTWLTCRFPAPHEQQTNTITYTYPFITIDRRTCTPPTPTLTDSGPTLTDTHA